MYFIGFLCNKCNPFVFHQLHSIVLCTLHVICLYVYDMSKAFDCIANDLLIEKLRAYGVDGPAIGLVTSYLGCRHQQTRLGPSASDWESLERGLP